jgi:hypothetical protein
MLTIPRFAIVALADPVSATDSFVDLSTDDSFDDLKLPWAGGPASYDEAELFDVREARLQRDTQHWYMDMHSFKDHDGAVLESQSALIYRTSSTV